MREGLIIATFGAAAALACAAFAPPTHARAAGGVETHLQVIDEDRLLAWTMRLTPPASGNVTVTEVPEGDAR